jgi:hypothetical protein
MTTVFSTTNSTALEILRGNRHQMSINLQTPTSSRPAALGLDPMDRVVKEATANIASIVAEIKTGETVDLSQREYSRAYVGGQNDAMFVGGGGRDFVDVWDRGNVTTGDGDDGIRMQNDATVDSGAGNDSISTYNNAKIIAGEGNDYVQTYAGSTVDSGGGDDYVYGYARLTVDAGSGNDEVRAYDHATVDAGDGDDLVVTQGYSSIKGGAGNDTIIVSEISANPDAVFGNSSIDAGEGDDFIQTGENSTIRGGAGNDLIRLTGAGSIVHFDKGDGHDEIMSREDFTVSLRGYSKDDVTVAVEGNDFVVTFKGSDDALTLNISSGATARLAFEDGSTLDVVAGEDYERMQLIHTNADWSRTRSVAYYYVSD